MKIFLLALFLIGLNILKINAQESINASGGNASGSNGSSAYSIGQVMYTTNTGTIGTIAQGVQQAYEISVVTGLEETKGLNLNLSVYPNPTSDLLILSVDNKDNEHFAYQLLDINSNTIDHNTITEKETSITMNHFANATYFLKITQNNKTIKTFKIIKN